MAEHRFTSATAMRDALRVNVPAAMRSKAGRVYFDAVSELHEAITVETPVRTGYLRAGLMASVEGSPAPGIAAREQSAAPGAYLPQAAAAAAQVGQALVAAVRGFLPITIGFLANYAPYVEDRVHMIKQARGRWGVIVRGAVARAKEAP